MKVSDTRPPVDQWLEIRRQDALKIDPEAAYVMCHYAPTLDPYGVYDEHSPDCQAVSLECFARAPDSHIWVSFQDLSKEQRRALEKKCATGRRDSPSQRGRSPMMKSGAEVSER
jgi:hypothetical protein